ncbi:hypothetical protein [Marinoscillum luteum]|jgi:hypothetical protein|uniref:Glycoside hydrolase n=1 Tax=Marinoscillum luteum TaxID=861051 RepID=A0ABW7NEI7_9BACT
MKFISNILLAVLVLSLFSCVKDPFADFEEGGWNNERSVLNIKFENQVGEAEIVRIDESTGVIELTINVDAVPDLSQIKVSSLQLSYGATGSVGIGDALNFENGDQSASMTVTSPTGKSRVYTITVDSFQESILGTYKVSNLIVYGGTGPEYGGGAVLAMTDKPWIWPETGGPQAELDNSFTLELTGITEDGNTYGTIVNDAGADGLYADFSFVLDPPTDINHFYRKVPAGAGEWLRNYATGTITFTFADGTTTSGSFIETNTTEDLGNGLSKTTTGHAFAFNLNGTDDWDKIYSDYDKFVKKPRRFWIDLEKQ